MNSGCAFLASTLIHLALVPSGAVMTHSLGMFSVAARGNQVAPAVALGDYQPGQVHSVFQFYNDVRIGFLIRMLGSAAGTQQVDMVPGAVPLARGGAPDHAVCGHQFPALRNGRLDRIVRRIGAGERCRCLAQGLEGRNGAGRFRGIDGFAIGFLQRFGVGGFSGGPGFSRLLGYLGERVGEDVRLSVFHKVFHAPFQRLAKVGAVPRFQVGG